MNYYILSSIPIIAISFLILGFILNIYKKLECWFCWILSSLLWLYYAIATEQYGLGSQNIVCICFHILGHITWRKEKKIKGIL